MKSDPTARENTKYCEFHRDYGHRTDDYIQLNREIKYLIRRRYLRQFISPENQPQNQAQNQALAQQPPPPPRQTTTQHQQPLGEIHVVATSEPGPTRMADPNQNPGDARLIILFFILLSFLFQNCRDPKPRPDPNGGSEPEPGLLRHFHLSY